jgi:hypothetical protein
MTLRRFHNRQSGDAQTQDAKGRQHRARRRATEKRLQNQPAAIWNHLEPRALAGSGVREDCCR